MKFNDIFIKFGNTSENGQSYPNQTVGLSKQIIATDWVTGGHKLSLIFLYYKNLQICR